MGRFGLARDERGGAMDMALVFGAVTLLLFGAFTSIGRGFQTSVSEQTDAGLAGVDAEPARRNAVAASEPAAESGGLAALAVGAEAPLVHASVVASSVSAGTTSGPSLLSRVPWKAFAIIAVGVLVTFVAAPALLAPLAAVMGTGIIASMVMGLAATGFGLLAGATVAAAFDRNADGFRALGTMARGIKEFPGQIVQCVRDNGYRSCPGVMANAMWEGIKESVLSCRENSTAGCMESLAMVVGGGHVGRAAKLGISRMAVNSSRAGLQRAGAMLENGFVRSARYALGARLQNAGRAARIAAVLSHGSDNLHANFDEATVFRGGDVDELAAFVGQPLEHPTVAHAILDPDTVNPKDLESLGNWADGHRTLEACSVARGENCFKVTAATAHSLSEGSLNQALPTTTRAQSTVDGQLKFESGVATTEGKQPWVDALVDTQATVEAVHRGDVTPDEATLLLDATDLYWRSLGVEEPPPLRVTLDDPYQAVVREVASWPEGSHGVITVARMDIYDRAWGAHIFNVGNIEGKVVFVENQARTSHAEILSSIASSANDIRIQRIGSVHPDILPDVRRAIDDLGLLTQDPLTVVDSINYPLSPRDGVLHQVASHHTNGSKYEVVTQKRLDEARRVFGEADETLRYAESGYDIKAQERREFSSDELEKLRLVREVAENRQTIAFMQEQHASRASYRVWQEPRPMEAATVAEVHRYVDEAIAQLDAIVEFREGVHRIFRKEAELAGSGHDRVEAVIADELREFAEARLDFEQTREALLREVQDLQVSTK